MTDLKVSYKISVNTNCGWRSEICTAIAKKISEKRIKIVSVLDIGENGNSGFASRTGAKRQEYSVSYFSKNEIGKIKNFTSVTVLV